MKSKVSPHPGSKTSDDDLEGQMDKFLIATETKPMNPVLWNVMFIIGLVWFIYSPTHFSTAHISVRNRPIGAFSFVSGARDDGLSGHVLLACVFPDASLPNRGLNSSQNAFFMIG